MIKQDLILTAVDLGKVIREARKKQRISQETLAGLSGTGRRLIVEIERGKATVQFGKILFVLQALGVALQTYRAWGVDDE